MSGALAKAQDRLTEYIRHPTKVGYDLLKKIMIYTLMMKNGADEKSFFQYLMTTPWFVETVDFYFGGEYERNYAEIVNSLTARGINQS